MLSDSISKDFVIDIKNLEKDNKILRAAMLKKRYADVIFKSQQQILGKAFDRKELKKKAELWEKQLREEKEKARARSQRQRDREAARITITSIKRTADFGDDLQVERDLLAIIGAPSHWSASPERDELKYKEG
ncbi:hypothetical protein HAX54_034759 [Datura stramonium]|uniref:Uncharacterized protein n=1 Tax=Datura stramonium TaxID=4076 RepID=A0ABS8RQ81_DATST|nr:hypothetical protein [Datura stramonium]